MSKVKLQQAFKKRYLEILDEEYIMSTNSNSLQGLVYWDEYIEFNRRATDFEEAFELIFGEDVVRDIRLNK